MLGQSLPRSSNLRKKARSDVKLKCAMGSDRNNKAHSFAQTYTANAHMPTACFSSHFIKSVVHCLVPVCKLLVTIYSEKSTEIESGHLETVTAI